MAAKLNSAVKKGDLKLVRQLLEDGADINAKVEGGWTPLHSAVQRNSEEIVNFLLENGADPLARKDNGATPFILAGVIGNVKLLKLFLDKGSCINEYDINGFTAFMEAACYGHKEALEFLYQNGADANQRREVDEIKKALKKGGATALMDAASHGHFALVKILVEEMGADVNICDNQDGNALIHALSEDKDWNKDREDSALFLLKNEIDVSKRDVNGKTVLILAVERESLDLVEAILKLDEVDLDDAGENNKTALHVAVEKKNKDIAKLLCEKGARVDDDVLDIAHRNYQTDMIELLQKYESPDSPRQPETYKEFSSDRWKSKLQKLNQMHRPMIGKLKIFQYQDLWIQKTTQGGVYLGLYDGKEVAVKVFWKAAENAKREKACLEKCQTSKYLVKFCGSEERKSCLYLCLSLCERNLQEYFKEESNATMESKKILKIIFEAVNELHAFRFGHQELHPSNILIDVTGKIFLADFDKSREITDDTKYSVISEDLQGLQKLILYVVMRGQLDFEHLPTECPETVKENWKEIEDLRSKLVLSDQTPLDDRLLEKLIYHPYFWPKETKYRVLREIGNEIRTKQGDIVIVLKSEDDPFMDWKTKIDEKVLESMIFPGKDKGSKKSNKKVKRLYSPGVVDLLKLIRNMGEHYPEKDDEVKEIIQDPADYFLNLFPDLTIYVYQHLHNSKYSKYFPNPNNSS
ncbi:2-5A-dependent ribonuclease [Thamnophis elegans]|uniref:2-5A-dependent ribonuclease n=1 Tax=Thamnophis elegans TaxID=35005 RepID=UPI00137675BD|nr:2-5A-dependent ribonuclease [Thamnophis elegans]XP_032082419.1 2-5A-dependent ribonuclease [Thamnophis elegans]XP_032082420.1 2-5A-dependent ribonuclease [Thamnophis elegans]XP_032082421.1 2-5A-dependent ribonuclease [Thamnophis elegans]XP_032082422.1 2-5A-dependent ribonuclease [Thamnophis elegans]